MNELMKELKSYLTDNFIAFKSLENKENTLLINGETYELFSVNEDGIFFDESFHWDGDRTEEDNYIFCFGSVWYFLKKGNENSVKLERVKWLGSVKVEEEALLQENFLGIHGPFELMNGLGSYKDWCRKANFLGVKTLGLCEKGTLAGTLKFQMACQKANIRSILGMEVPIQINDSDSRYSVKAFVKDEKGWRNLLWLNKIVNVDGEGFVSEKDLKDCSEGLIIVYDPKTVDFNNLPSEVWLKDRAYFQIDTVVYKKEERDEVYLKNLGKFFRTKMKPVLMSDAYYLEKEYSPIRSKLNRVLGTMNYESDNQYFKNGEELYWELTSLFNEKDFERVFSTFTEATQNLNHICNSCNFSIDTSQRHLPKYYMTPEEEKLYGSNEEMFRELVYKGIEDHIDLLDNFSFDVIAERIEREIDVIQDGGVVDYFLILRDIVNWCKKERILLGTGRGSACGSICSYLLRITQANPLEYDLLFERFLNKSRAKVSLPDVDLDFESEKRPLVKAYMERRFGIDQVCSVGTYTTLQIKAALSDLCRLEGVPIQEVRRITAKFGEEKEKSMEDFLKTVSASEELRNFVVKHSDIINDVFIVLGSPKAASIHACATMIFPDEKTMFGWAPVRRQKDIIVSEWEGGELDEAGFLKEDILGIAQLDKFHDILKLIEQNSGKRINIYKDIPLDDSNVYNAMGEGFLGDIFHFGSKGLSSYTTQMKPRNIEELSACAALYRPGAIENNFHNEYLLRRSGEREVDFHIGTEKILGTTQGIFIYQEQIMALMHELAGMDLVTCDTARKAMGKKKIEVIQTLETQFIEGYCSRYDVKETYAKEFWDEIVKSSSYLFNKSHSVAYSINGYNSMWLKIHHPIEFWAVTFSRAKMEEFPFYLNEIKNSGSIEVKPVNINKSQIDIVADPSTNSMYWAFNSVDQVGEKAQAQLIEERDVSGEYFSLDEFIDRQVGTGSAVNKSVVENLIYSGAFDEIENISSIQERGHLLQQFRELRKVKIDLEKDEYTLACTKGKQNTDWWWRLQQKRKSGFAYFDYEVLVDQYLRKNIGKEWTFITGDEVRDWDEGKSGYKVCVGGYVIEMQERKSKKGPFCNLVLECNYEFIKVLVFPELFEEYSDFLRNCKDSILLLNGNIIYNKFHNAFVLQTSQSTEFVKVGSI